MKQFRSLATAAVAGAFSLFFLSCGSGSDKKDKEAAKDTTATTAVTETPPPPPAKPGKFAVIIHKVQNFAKWKPFYDADDSNRVAAGLHTYVMGRGLDDSNVVVIIMKMDDVDKARAMSTSAALKAKMQKAGVIGKPTFYLVEAVMNDTSMIDQKDRVMVAHNVKDWDAWKKVFDSHKQIRTDNGIMDRAVSHEVGDTHAVRLVFAFSDLKKSKAYFATKEQKDRMAEAGVDGPTTYTYYQIIQKY